MREVRFDAGPVEQVSIKPNYPRLGPRLGRRVQQVAADLAAGRYEELAGGGVRVAGEDLDSADIVRGERVDVAGWAIAYDGEISVAVDTSIDAELRLEGRALDLVRLLNDMRKSAGLDLTDRIMVRLGNEFEDLVEHHGDLIAAEVLAVRLEVDSGVATPQIEKT